MKQNTIFWFGHTNTFPLIPLVQVQVRHFSNAQEQIKLQVRINLSQDRPKCSCTSLSYFYCVKTCVLCNRFYDTIVP